MADDAKAQDQLLRITQDLFILQALQAGARTDAIRRHLQIKNTRVTQVSKLLVNRRRADPE
jgi:hypothetical protein